MAAVPPPGMPPMPMPSGGLDATDAPPDDSGADGSLDPQFAADASEAFPDMDDKQLTALQRAISGLIGR